jgi:hypothetical protein
MSGLHGCPRCGYRFEDAPSLAAHLEACDGDSNGQPTGRSFIVDEDGDITAMATNGASLEDAAGGEDHIWLEYKDADGDLWYVSDHEEYTLSAEEFGPISWINIEA